MTTIRIKDLNSERCDCKRTVLIVMVNDCYY